MSMLQSLGPHAGFIVAAYAVTAAVVTALIAWVVADQRTQRRTLAELETRGATRRATAAARLRKPETTAATAEKAAGEPA